MTSGYLFDSHALLAFFQNEIGATIVCKILQKTRKEHIDRLVCIINLGEIIYITKRMFGICTFLIYTPPNLTLLSKTFTIKFVQLCQNDFMVFYCLEKHYQL